MALAFDIYLHDKHNIENLHHIIPNMQTDLFGIDLLEIYMME